MNMSRENEIVTLKKRYSKLIEEKKKNVGKFFNEQYMRSLPMLYNELKDISNKNEFIYNLILDIKESPTCKICGEKVSLRSFEKGYNTCCSAKCVGKLNSTSIEFREKISSAMKAKFDEEYYTKKYSYVKRKEGENFLISGYCNHGDFTINKNLFARRLYNGHEICEKCAEERMKDENVQMPDHKRIHFLSEERFKMHYPELYGKIVRNCRVKDASFMEKKYL